MADAIPGHGSHLERYAAAMTGAEINSSFHRPHRRSTYERWAASTPEGFRFSVKLPKDISHTRKLIGTEEKLDAFVQEISGLGAKLAVVLLQCPPKLEFDPAVASTFFMALRLRLDPGIEIAMEPRHASWFTEQADTCLTDHRVARVAADPVLVPDGERPGGWTGLRYRRLHGSPRVYYSPYDEHQLAALANALASDREIGIRSWCIFDNTASGSAMSDAMKLRSLLAC